MRSRDLWRRWVVPPTAWEDMRVELRRIINACLPSVERAIREPDPLVSLILGKVFSAASNMERSLVTKLGQHAFLLVKPFFQHCVFNGTFWHMKCYRMSDDGEQVYFTVKVVSGVRAFNSTMRGRVDKESRSLTNPIVLTLTGKRRNPVTRIGDALWLDAPATWQWLSGSRVGYRRFLDIVYEEAAPVRDKLRKLFWNEYKTYISSRKRGADER